MDIRNMDYELKGNSGMGKESLFATVALCSKIRVTRVVSNDLDSHPIFEILEEYVIGECR